MNRTTTYVEQRTSARRTRPTPDRDLLTSEPLAAHYAALRYASLALAAPLSAEDCQVQSMPDASPTKWHLAHITWFFETFILARFEAGFVPFDPVFRVLFNSYTRSSASSTRGRFAAS